eukprot:4887163-Pleurochrysis_carterae.AAC.1
MPQRAPPRAWIAAAAGAGCPAAAAPPRALLGWPPTGRVPPPRPGATPARLPRAHAALPPRRRTRPRHPRRWRQKWRGSCPSPPAPGR